MRNLAFAQDNLFLCGVLQDDYPVPSISRDGEDYSSTHGELGWRPITEVVGSASGEAGSIVHRGRSAFDCEAPANSFTVIRLKSK
jgi:hypothetical protein